MNESAKEALSQHLNRIGTAPFLFVGSGLSRRYMGLENWTGLLQKFSEACDKDFGYYISSANNNLPIAASLLAKDFHAYWWSNDKYKESLDANKDKVKLIHDPLKIEIAKYIAQAEIINTPDVAIEVDLFKKIIVDGIITTNYDTFLEKCFPEYKVYVGQDNMLFSSPSGIGEIYKIHGSCDDAKTLILTDEDYADYNRKNSYLAAKLLAFFTEHPIIFLGYSLSDDNIQSIISSIAQCLDASNIDKLRDRLIIISYDSTVQDASITNSTRVFDRDIRVPFLSVSTNNFSWIYEVLSQMQRQFSAKVLRQLKEQVYELVMNNASADDSKKLYVLDIEKADEHNQLEVVFGVGAIKQVANKGYEGLTREDLMHDLLEERNYNANEVIHRLEPRFLVQSPYTPLYKYLRKADYLDDSGKILRKEELDRIIERTVGDGMRNFGASGSTYKNRFKTNFRPNLLGKTLAEQLNFLSKQDPKEILYCMPHCPEELLSLDWMYDFLIKHKSYIATKAQPERSLYAKFISMYDFLRYGKVHKVV